MAEIVYKATVNTVEQPQGLSDDTNLCCASCVIVKEQLRQVFEELKSARTIIALLQEDIAKLNASASNNMTKPTQFRESSVHDHVNSKHINK